METGANAVAPKIWCLTQSQWHYRRSGNFYVVWSTYSGLAGRYASQAFTAPA